MSKLSRCPTDDSTNRKCDIEIWKYIGIKKDSFQKLYKILWDKEMSLETNKRALNCYVIFVIHEHPHRKGRCAFVSIL